jgi:hypothetical protein
VADLKQKKHDSSLLQEFDETGDFNETRKFEE